MPACSHGRDLGLNSSGHQPQTLAGCSTKLRAQQVPPYSHKLPKVLCKEPGLVCQCCFPGVLREDAGQVGHVAVCTRTSGRAQEARCSLIMSASSNVVVCAPLVAAQLSAGAALECNNTHRLRHSVPVSCRPPPARASDQRVLLP